jgi:sugar/nucleoside kinase (ribokinase family)
LPVVVAKLFNHRIAEAVALTLGARGLVLFEASRQSVEVDGLVRYLPEYVPALSRYAVDPLGAGDALTTAASLTRLAGGGYVEAALLGSAASAVVVARLGNEPLTLDAMHRYLETHQLFPDESV